MKNMKTIKSIVAMLVMVLALGYVSITAEAASAPSGLVQTDDSKEQVKVQWNAVVEPNVYGYNVYYSTSPTGAFVRVGTGNYDTTSTYDFVTKLSAGQSYWVCVSTVTRTKSGYSYVYTEGPKSAAIEVVTAPNVANSALVQTDASTSSITMNYSGAIGANYYVATIDNVVVGESTTGTIKTSVALQPATEYWIKEYACRVSSSGYVAQGSYGYTHMKTLANKISTKNFGCSNVYENINVYNFAAVVGDGGKIDGCEFQFMKPNGKSKKTFSTTGTSIRIEKFINGTFRKYRVRTYVDCNGVRKYSAWSDYNYIGVSKKMTCKTRSNSRKIELTWKKISGASRYVLYISTKENSGYKKVATLNNKKTSYNFTKYNKKSLKSKKTYYVKLVPQVKVGKKYKNSEVVFYWKARMY